MVLKPVRHNWNNRRCRIKDRRDASIIKNNNTLKRMGMGKGNWGTELDAQIFFEEFGNDMEMETEETEMETFASTAATLQGDTSGTRADTTAAREDKPDETKVLRNRKGYKILEIVRNFEPRASQIKMTEILEENHGPDAGGDESEKAKEDSKLATGKPSGGTSKTSVKSPDTTELQKAAALRFKNKGPAWGITPKEDAKKPKLSAIKEELKQKGNSKAK